MCSGRLCTALRPTWYDLCWLEQSDKREIPQDISRNYLRILTMDSRRREWSLFTAMWMSGIPVNIQIKCRENTIDGGRKKKKEISIYVQIVPCKEKLRLGRLCSPLWHGSKWQSVFEPSNSGCALVLDTISRSRTASYSSQRLVVTKTRRKSRHFSIRKAFLKNTNKKNPTSLHGSHTHTYKHRSGCWTQRTYSVC